MSCENHDYKIDKIYSMGKDLTDTSRTISGEVVNCLLDSLAQQALPIEIQLDNSWRDYHTTIKFVKGSKDVDGLYMLIDALDPKIGNAKIRSSSDITLRVFHEKYLIEISSFFVGIVPVKSALRITIPKTIVLTKQKRATFRIRTYPDWKVKCTVVGQNGYRMDSRIINISAGGFSFESERQTRKILPNTEIECKIKSKVYDKIKVPAKILACDTIPNGGIKGRCRFMFEKGKEEQQINGLVSTFQRLELQKRNEHDEWSESND